MSGIFGIFNRNGKDVDRQIVKKMLDATSYWEPDDEGIWVDGPVALGHTMLWNTPESKYEHLPLKNETYILTIDARIDNRDELLEQLELGDRPIDKIGDSEFVLAAYKKWEEECPKHLLGDFAFVIWDEKKQHLFCARDHIGIKPFYYYLNNKYFVFSNDIRGLIANPNIPKTINDEAVAIYLTVGELWDDKMTFFESIQKLPPASILRISAETMSQKSYWKAENSPKIQINSLEEYSKILRNLLEDAVHKRLRSDESIASHLSGGLDSSTIASIAARYLHKKNKSLQVYNWVAAPTQNDDPEYYEWANSRRIAELEKIEHHYIELNAEKISEILKMHDISMNDTVDLSYEFLVREEAKQKKVCTILSGWGGDELISYNGDAYYSDMLYSGKIFSIFHEFFNQNKRNKHIWKQFISMIYYQLLLPNLPTWLYSYLPRVKYHESCFLQCTNNDFRKLARLKVVKKAFIAKANIRSDQLDKFYQGHIINRIESWASSSFKEKIEYRYPLLDKRIVEFALGLPAEMYQRDGKKRFLFRYSISGLLPEDIRWGNFKSETNRVNLLSQIEQDAISIWISKFKEKNKDNISNQYINYELLEELAVVLNKLGNVSLKEKYVIIDTIMKSIFVFNIGHESKLVNGNH